MKLQEFVSQTLKEIIAGVKEAQECAASQKAKVSPVLRRIGVKGGQYETYNHQPPEYVEFDVAVTSTEGSEKTGGVGIFVAGFARHKNPLKKAALAARCTQEPLGSRE